MKTLEELKAGDMALCQPSHSDIWKPTIVERVTKTMIVTPAGRFNRKTGQSVGSVGYSFSILKVGTDKEIAKARTDGRRRVMYHHNWDTVSDELVNKIWELLRK